MRDCFKSLLVLATAIPTRVVRAFASAPAPSWRAPTLAPTTSLSTSLLFLHERNQSPSAPSSCYISDDDINIRELQFDMIGLMREEEDAGRQARKAEALTSIIHACSLSDGRAGETEAVAVLPEHLAPLRRFLCTSPNAKDHQGCFRIFTKKISPSPSAVSLPSPPVSMPPNVLFSQERPFMYLRDSLSYQSEATIQKQGGILYDSSEAVVWCSSIVDNKHHPREELEFASKVLDDMPFAQLHLGSGLGSRNCHGEDVDCNNHLAVELDLETVQALESMGVLLGNDGDVNNRDRCGTHTVCCKLKLGDIAVIETILDCHKQQHAHVSLRDQQQQQSTLFKMIDSAVEVVRKDPLNKSNEPQLVLLAHSVSASAVAAAISAWKRHQTQQKRLPTRRVEDLLHQAVTVVTFGNVWRSFCDGPAYIHVSMYDDPWNAALGSHSNNARHGGKGAVYFHASSPYEYDQVRWEEAQPQATPAILSSLTCHNAHNLNACTIQYLCLIMRINGIESFRALYDAANFVDPTFMLDINPKLQLYPDCSHGDLIVPPHIDDELLPAMIRATRGDEWIWKVDGDRDGDVESLLPDEIETRSHLGHLYDVL